MVTLTDWYYSTHYSTETGSKLTIVHTCSERVYHVLVRVLSTVSHVHARMENVRHPRTTVTLDPLQQHTPIHEVT